jgi:hypothetical protein
MCSIFLLLASQLLAGCVDRVEPTSSELDVAGTAFIDPPDITLTRNVSLEHGTKTVRVYIPVETETVGRSRFGAPDTLANLQCVVDGFRKVVTGAEILPAAIFWNSVADERDEIKLSDLYFDSSLATRLKDKSIDVLVAAYHYEFDRETVAVETVLHGIYLDMNRQVAAAATIDLKSKKILHASMVTVDEETGFGHVFIWPIAGGVRATSDPCAMIGEAASHGVGNYVSKPAPRVVVVAAKNNPFEAIKEWKLSKRYKERKLSKRYIEPPEKELVRRVDAGDPAAMYEFANSLPIGAGLERLQWYCRAAHAGYAKSQYQFGRYHHHGYVIEKNPVQAYLWYKLSLATEQTKEAAAQREKLSGTMTPAQIAEAERLVAEWEPLADGISVEADIGF